jgi:calcium/calmodulin-dependent protein kinase I
VIATVHFVEWFQSRYSYYVVYEVATGGDLFDRLIGAGHFSEPDAKRAMRAILVRNQKNSALSLT